MPTYEYECPKGHRFEVFQRMTDKPVATCPKCKARARRQISGGAGFLFKGEGFYITDYRSEDYKKKASAESGGSSEKSSKPEAPAKAKSEGSEGKGGAKAKATKTKTSSEA
jgi:putative FmdB family regulatory protein